MVFSGIRHFGGKAACRDVHADTLAPASEAVSLQAAFCHDDKVLSQAHIRFDASQADGDGIRRRPGGSRHLPAARQKPRSTRRDRPAALTGKDRSDSH